MKQQMQDLNKFINDPNFSKLFKTVAESVKSDITTEAEKPQAKSTLKKLSEAGLKIAKSAAPSLVSLIPGIGPIASQLLTTLNDDEWFSEFKGNGATFNEWLKVYIEKVSNTGIKIPAAYAGYVEIPTAINSVQGFWDDYMPTILAYVREKTNNVLVDDVVKYKSAFVSASNLLAIYYHGAKLLELSANQPLNIPDIPGRISVISPGNYASFAGTIKSLGEFIKSTIRLPYAWTEYIRWRFGTIFESENTGKPALISYSYLNDINADITTTIPNTALCATASLDVWSTIIAANKADYIASGRAGADLKLAYDDHDLRLTVEKRHYDEKEFNLRCNFTSEVNNGWAYRNKGNTILLDSRLDMNAAIQAVTISTVGVFPGDSTVQLPPFVTKAPIIHFYMDQQSFDNYTDFVLHSLVLDSIFVKFQLGWNYIIWRHNYNEELKYNSTDASASGYGEGGTTGILAYVHDQLAAALAASAQLHNRPNYAIACGDKANDRAYCAVAITPLSYDIATVSGETINNLHRAAMRNLIRGNYKRKQSDGAKQEVKDEVKEISKVVTELDKK